MADVDRGEILEAWDTLEHMISDWMRGRVSKEDMLKSYREYVSACMKIQEGYFSRYDIINDDLPHIPFDYPHSGPADFPLHGGCYDTPLYKARREQIGEALRRLNNKQ